VLGLWLGLGLGLTYIIIQPSDFSIIHWL